MDKFLQSLKSPWQHGGIIAGILDAILRITALVIWLCVTWLAIRFVYDSLFIEVIWAKKMWWIGYSAIIFTTVTVLAYIAIWDRN